MKNSFTAFFLLLILISPGCSPALDGEGEKIEFEYIAGELNDEFTSRISSFPDHSTVMIISQGGDPDFAQEVIAIMQKKKLNTALGLICLSSCAEYFLFGQGIVNNVPGSLIGLHQSPKLMESLKNREVAYRDKDLCEFQDNVSFLDSKFGKDYSERKSWEVVLKKLDLQKVEYREQESCVSVGFSFAVDFWLPNSNQLNSLFGVELQNPVCADNKKECRDAVDKYLPYGTKVLIDNEVYVSDH